MHMPLTQNEIAEFLRVDEATVWELWVSGALQRTYACGDRPIEALNFCTVFDVIEYALTSNNLSVTLSKEQAALWIELLAEAGEDIEFEEGCFSTKEKMLAQAAACEGLHAMTEDSAKVISVLLDTQQSFKQALSSVPRSYSKTPCIQETGLTGRTEPVLV